MPCPLCPTAPQRFQVLAAAITVYSGLWTPLSLSQLNINDTTILSPIAIDVSAFPSFIMFFQGQSITQNFNTTAIAFGQISIQTTATTPGNISSNIVPTSLYDGATMGPYPLIITLLSLSSSIVQVQNIRYWNQGLPVSLLSFLNTTNAVANSSQIFYNVSNMTNLATFSYRNGTAGIKSFSQQSVNLDQVLITLPTTFAGSVTQNISINTGLNFQSVPLSIQTGPVTSGFILIPSNSSLSSVPLINNVTIVSQSILFVQGKSFNNGSNINYVKVNSTLCPIINMTISNLFCIFPSNFSSSNILIITMFTMSNFFSWNSSFTYIPINLSPAANQSFVILGVSIAGSFFLVSLGLLLFWLHQRRRLYIKDNQSLESEINRKRWEIMQLPTEQYVIGLTSKISFFTT